MAPSNLQADQKKKCCMHNEVPACSSHRIKGQCACACLSFLSLLVWCEGIKFLLTCLLKHGLEVAVRELHLASTPEERLTQKGSHLWLNQTDQLHTATISVCSTQVGQGGTAAAWVPTLQGRHWQRPSSLKLKLSVPDFVLKCWRNFSTAERQNLEWVRD